jgi:ubiquinone/menaquinone biosynthesis C-methylase UbiE
MNTEWNLPASSRGEVQESLDRVVSSMVFHHLNRENKVRALKEIFRVLRPGGELHIADFGKPHKALMYLILFSRHFEETSDNIKGLLPEMFRQAGLASIINKLETPANFFLRFNF